MAAILVSHVSDPIHKLLLIMQWFIIKLLALFARKELCRLGLGRSLNPVGKPDQILLLYSSSFLLGYAFIVVFLSL